MKIQQSRLLLLAIANLAALPVLAQAQSPPNSKDSSGTVAGTTPAQPDLPYTRPTQAIKLATISSTGSARIPSSARRSRLALARPVMESRSGGKALRVTANASGPTSESRR